MIHGKAEHLNISSGHGIMQFDLVGHLGLAIQLANKASYLPPISAAFAADYKHFSYLKAALDSCHQGLHERF